MKAEELAGRAKEAAERSYSPYSKVRVGCALETTDGRVFTGCNIENASFSLTLCAERVALFKAISEGATGFRRVAIWSDTGFHLVPCGACLGVLAEWVDKSTGEVILAGGEGSIRSVPFREFLPMDLSDLEKHLR
ncbi:MAG: cytidine deaminase [Candidatus Eisenbacteria bacterium]|nr:cytidine deaminase [Candidatus Eisenbacteria bacterium]